MKIIHYVNDKEEKTYNNVENLNKENNENYQFILDNISNNIYITDRFVFERNSDDYTIKIEIGENANCSITLKDKNLSFDVKVIEGKYEISEENISFEYVLETEENKHKIVIEK